MTKEEAKEFYPILQAFAEGKAIECRTKPGTISTSIPNEWTEMKEIGFWNGIEYRIKPDPKYHPFKDADECWKEMLKHQPFGWIKCDNGYFNIVCVDEYYAHLADKDCSAIGLVTKNSYLDNTFADGTPFGIKLEE